MMAKEFAVQGPPLRLLCPECETTWETLQCPSECPTCGALITVRAIRKGTVPPQEPKPDPYAEVRTKGDLRDFKTADFHLNRED